MTIPRARVLAALTALDQRRLVRRLAVGRGRGRPWSRSLGQRILIACTALRTNLTIRELAAVFRLSKSSAHRIVAAMVPRLAMLASSTTHHDRRWSWIVDGTLIPTRDHRYAAKSKNYRWSCNAQVLVRRRDLRVIAASAAGAGNRNDPVHYRASPLLASLCAAHGRVLADGGYRGVTDLVTPTFREGRIVRDRAWRRHRHRRARVEHALARLKDWRMLRDHRRRGECLADTLNAVAFLHNLRQGMRDNS